MLMIEGNLHFDEVLKRIIKIERQNGLTWTTWKMFLPAQWQTCSPDQLVLKRKSVCH